VDGAERVEQLAGYEQAQAERGEGTLSRAATAAVRQMISGERDAQATRRDENATTRDQVAAERDQVSERADVEADRLARRTGDVGPTARTALDAAASARALAAASRTKAALDREKAARDREAAAQDREFLRGELERSQLDELTGAYRRGLGEILLRHEMSRANRLSSNLTLVFIDVDQLKATNTQSGHSAGDELLRSVFSGIQSRLRPFDPITRWGGDEFVCTVAGVQLAEAEARIEKAQEDLAACEPPISITVGFAAMEPGDTLTALIGRADAANRERKGTQEPM
jgi:diguanylate cyclase (GGDEF)-like protein